MSTGATEFEPESNSRPSVFSSFFTQRAIPVDFECEHVLVADTQQWIWLIERGAIDLFAARLEKGEPVGRWTPLCRLEAGAMFLLGAPAGPQHHIVARAVQGAAVSRMSLEALAELTGEHDSDAPGAMSTSELAPAVAQLVSGIDATLVGLAKALRNTLPPQEFVALESTDPSSLRAGTIGRSISGVRWIRVLSGSITTREGGMPGTFRSGSQVCITELDWVEAEEDSVVEARSTSALLDERTLWAALVAQSVRIAYALDRRIERWTKEEGDRLRSSHEMTAQLRRHTERSFHSILVESSNQRVQYDYASDLPEYRCAQFVAARMGIQLWAPEHVGAAGGSREIVSRIASFSGVRTRSVRLLGSWWKQDLGPMVGYRRMSVGAVALTQIAGGYLMVDEDGGSKVVDRSVAATLEYEATVLYRPLPPKVRGAGPLVRFGLAGARDDGWRFLFVGLAVAVLGLLVPIISGKVLGAWVVEARGDLVHQGALLVIVSAFAIAGLTYVQNMAVLRLEGRVDYSLQAAIWDRLLSLPITFFSRYSAAELGTVALGISTIRETLSTVTTAAVVGLMIGSLNLALLFFYSVPLGLVAVGMVVVSSSVTLYFGRRALNVQRTLYRSEQKLSARSFQLLTGLTTIRMAAAEDRAFARWAKDYGLSLSLSIRVRRSQATVTTFSAGFMLVSLTVIFALVGGPLRTEVSLAAFLSFFTAFNILMGSVVQFATAAMAAVSVIPMFEDLDPIIECEPELTTRADSPGDLSGHIDFRNVSFQYAPDAPLVLDSVSFTVQPGEFVALVGETGSGKSTIVRLLLGFDHPISGAILYDGKDLRQMNAADVRKQCGVVLQNGALLAGDIATNIIGSSGRSVEDAWCAARMAGIAADIEALPMGMLTMISEGANSLSGGQRQRLMIARSLVSSPRILIFDEATSALDNLNQLVVTESTHRLNATRIVIAHRLSTIQNADRIIVLKGGRVAQVGRYEELLDEQDGAFAQLVRRQVRAEAVGIDGQSAADNVNEH